MQWFIDNGCGVMDVNIPSFVGERNDSTEAAFNSRREMMEKLAVYLWDNYIEYACGRLHRPLSSF